MPSFFGPPVCAAYRWRREEGKTEWRNVAAMRTSRWVLPGGVFAALAGAASGQAVPDEQVSGKADEFVSSELRAQHMPGVALAVMRDGKIVKAAGYGMANIELGVATKPESIFQTGSVGKQFTATAVMMLVERGKVGLDDKISKYFPIAPAAAGNDQRYRLCRR
jgi:CubicO group peptidase (beta-lactamase class C family)